MKEGTVDTVIENNYCAGQMDEDSGGIDSRANSTIIRYNKVEGCKGAGIRLGGHKVGNNQFGIACQVGLRCFCRGIPARSFPCWMHWCPSPLVECIPTLL